MNNLRIKDVCEKVFILAYKEDTSHLESALQSEGFRITVLRPKYSPVELEYNSNIRCMLNHRDAMNKIAVEAKPVIVCEADFVPCKGLGNQPYPIPGKLGEKSWVWLYSNRPVISGEIYAHAFEGASNSTVCYLAPPAAAVAALKFYEHVMITRDPREYFDFDNHLPKFVAQLGIKQLIARRSLGEHGGICSPVHSHITFGTASQQAEVLVAPVCFLPPYAGGSRLKYWWFRLRFKIRAFARVAGFRIARIPYLASQPSLAGRIRVVWFVVVRLLTFY